MIEVLKKSHRLCVLQVSRGSGPRAVEAWVNVNASTCFDGISATGLGQQEKPMLASQFYSAYAQSLVIFVRSVSDLACLSHMKLTVYCLVKGCIEQKMLLNHEFDDAAAVRTDCDNPPATIITPVTTVPSNSFGAITLLHVSNSAATSIRPRQFRRHLKAAGYPVLGRAKDSTPFRGEALCMSVMCLEFSLNNVSSANQRHQYSNINRFELAIPTKFQTIMEREERFWNQRRVSGGITSTMMASSSLLPSSPYHTGATSFCGSMFTISPFVMIPRKGSEALVDLVVKLYNEQITPSAPHVLDLGTGSGCLLLAILLAIDDSIGVGIDASNDALKVARGNSTNKALYDRCRFQEATFDDLSKIQESRATFDIVVCNPPYHTRGGRQLLDAAVAKHEPDMALFVEKCDMLVHYRNALRGLVGGSDESTLLATNAIVVFEVFCDNAKHVSMLMMESGLSDVKIGVDSPGCVRTVQGRWL